MPEAGRRAASTESTGPAAVRVDRWLFAVRVCKTRTAATEACRGGHVRVNGAVARASTPVRAGDRVEVRARGSERILEVVRVIEARVGAPSAATCLVDHTPAPSSPAGPFAPGPVVSDRGSGRPTKRDRRRLDRLRTR